MKRSWSNLVNSITESGTVAITDRVQQLLKDGVKVINLGTGDPDFDTPKHITNTAIEAIDKGFTHYVDSKGTLEMRKAVSSKFKTENNLDYDFNNEIIVTASGKLALFLTLVAIIEPGDEVIILEPAWVSYKPLIQLLGGVPVPVSLSIENNYLVTEGELRNSITQRTKAIIINSPNNPTGRVLTYEELQAIRNVAVDKEIWVISDEIYEHIIYEGKKHISIAGLPGMRERTVTINGLSKSYAMTGWRLGYLGGPRDLVVQILKVQQHVVTCAASFTQTAGATALTGSMDCVQEMVQEYERRKNWMVKALNEIPGITCPSPEGAFYLFPRIAYKGMNSFQLAQYILDQAHVAVAPGQVFGEEAIDTVRLTFATSFKNLVEAAMRIKEILNRGCY